MIKDVEDKAVGEKRVLLERVELEDPGDLKGYEALGGFTGLDKAHEMSPEAVIETVKDSGLRGRGGAGFPCGVKWELARQSPNPDKVLILNADEGEVGTFKDRYILEHNPYMVLEGMAIGAYAIGADKGYIYLRDEYHYLLTSLEKAVSECKEEGYLNDLEVEIVEGAGAYICGEESALMNSIEGKRGESRYRPPFPPEKGLFEQPTIINNVETLSNVPLIVEKGAEWYAALGTEKSKGTKLFCVSGDVKRPGVYELELGTSLKEVMGLSGAESPKWVQVGGSTGRLIPSDRLDTALSYEGVLGSGAVMVSNGTRDVIEFVYRTLEFLNEESCGKCAPCREGTEVLVEILGRLTQGEGSEQDLINLETLSEVMMDASLCGLGQTAPIPVLDSLRYFREVYEARIEQSLYLRGLRTVKA
ncbi:MAG: SLBB domain-containing protein [Deltaproteobacteria bacterium]|nr:SLBB domain-containing protein [Deltaproteobacteria bacterium]